MLVYFQGRGDWFFNPEPNNKFGPRLAHNFVFKDTETGETESTNEFFRLYDGIDQKLCNEFVGVFKLSKEDIATYLGSNNFDHVEKLLPCAHEYSGFIISLEENGYLSLSENDLDNCFFLIQKEIDMSCFEHRKISMPPYAVNNKLEVFDESKLKKASDNQPIRNNDLQEVISEKRPAYLNKCHKFFDTNKELHLAIAAWNAIVEQEKGSCKNIKKNIINWLSSYSEFKLTDDQKNRIATVANPDRARKKKDALMIRTELALGISDSEKYLDYNHNNHSSWLRAAIEAWMYTLSDIPEPPKTGSLKSLPIKWLKDNYPAISKSNVERLAVLINPDSNGGAPKSI